MAYILMAMDKKTWRSSNLENARRKAYDLIDGKPHDTIFIFNDEHRYIGAVQWFRTVEDPRRNIYKEHIAWVCRGHVRYLDGRGEIGKMYPANTSKFVISLVERAKKECGW